MSGGDQQMNFPISDNLNSQDLDQLKRMFNQQNQFQDQQGYGQDFSGQNFSGQNFSGQNFSGQNFSGQNFSGQNFSEQFNGSNDFNQSSISDGDVTSRYNKMLAERDQSKKMSNGSGNPNNFNPMISPNLNQNFNGFNNNGNQMLSMQQQQMYSQMLKGYNPNNLNFKGMGVGNNNFSIFDSLDDDELDNCLRNMKENITKQLEIANINPSMLDTLDSKTLGKIIKKISIDLSGINSAFKNSTANGITEIVEQSYKMADENNNMNYNVNHNMDNNRHNRDENYDGHSDKSNYENFTIKSEECAEQNEYNDYRIEFKTPIENIKVFKLIKMEFPDICHTIHNNSINYVINGENKIVNIENGVYNLHSLIDEINKLTKNDIQIMTDNNGNFIIQSIHDDLFSIFNDQESVLQKFGFSDNRYENRSKYNNDVEASFGKKKKIYFFIEELSPSSVFSFYSDSDFNKQLPTVLKRNISSLSKLTLKFKYDNNANSNNMVDMYERPHTLEFQMEF